MGAPAARLLNDLAGVFFVDPLHGWAIGDGAIIGTADGGATWSLQMGASGLPSWWYDDSDWTWLSGIAFADAQRGWVVGAREIWRGPDEGVTAVVLRTVDGGATWKRSVPSRFEGFMGVTCRSADEVWAVGGGNAVARSTDGGATWTRQTDEAPAYLYDIAWVDALHGWAIGSSGDTDWLSSSCVEVGVALHPVDGGANWDPVDIPALGIDLPVSVRFFGPEDGRIMLESDRVVVTADGGAAWAVVGSCGERSVVFSDVAVAGDEVWAVGARGDGFAGRPRGDSPGVVWYSGDGGGTWRSCDDPLIDAGSLTTAFPRGGEVWVAGVGGRILHTADGGLTWEKQVTGVGITFTALAFTDADNGWAVSRSLPGAVMRTTDGGAGWRVTQVRDTNDATDERRARYFDVGVLGDRYVWLAGMEYRSDCEENGPGMVTRSAEGGASWTVSIAGQRAVQKLVLTTPDTGWALSGGPDSWSGVRQLLRTTDGGATWVKQVISDGRGRYTFSDLYFTADGQGWILASSGDGSCDDDAMLLRTPDAGAHWGLQRLGAGTELNALTFADDVRGWAVGSGGTILATTDGGGIAPVSCDNVGVWGVRWTNKPFTVRITTYDGGYGLAPTRTRLDAGPWEEPAKRVIAAPRTHANDGIHIVRYQGVDLAGNRERPNVCGVIVDTTPPTVKAPRSARAVKGRRASLRIKPYDKLAGYVRLRVVVKTPGGKTVKTLRGSMWADNKVRSFRFHCRLDKGRYRFFVHAKDPAGNQTPRPASNWLTVR